MLSAAGVKTLYESNANTNAFTDSDDTKLADTETTTQLDARDVADRNRANHTGTQLAATVSDFNEAAQDAISTAINDQKGIAVVYADASNQFDFVLKSAPQEQNSNYDIAYDDEYLYYTGTANITYSFGRITSSSALRSGLQYWIYNNGTGNITLAPGSGATLVGGISVVPPGVLALVTYRVISGSDNEIFVYAFPTAVQSNWNETDTNDLSFIQNKPTIRPDHWRGTWNNSTVYQAGDFVRHLSEGAERVFLATTAINSGQPAPPAGPATGAWLEVDVKQWRGPWNSGNIYRGGDIAISSSNLWMALTTIGVGGTVPSLTNTNWMLVGRQNAAQVATDTTNFNDNLSPTDTTVQAALETIDNLPLSNRKVFEGYQTFTGNITLAYTGTNSPRQIFVFTGTSAATVTVPIAGAATDVGIGWFIYNDTELTVTLAAATGAQIEDQSQVVPMEAVWVYLKEYNVSGDEIYGVVRAGTQRIALSPFP